MSIARPFHTTCCLVAALLSCGATAAHAADCAPVIAAYAKADATKRFAVYDTDGIDKPIKGPPFYVMMNGTYWVQHFDHPTPMQMVPHGYDQSPYSGSIQGPALADDVKAGKRHCEPLGEKTAGATTLTGWLVRDNSKGQDFTALQFWIDTATGLPAYHGLSQNQGLKWVYGDAVTPPK